MESEVQATSAKTEKNDIDPRLVAAAAGIVAILLLPLAAVGALLGRFAFSAFKAPAWWSLILVSLSIPVALLLWGIPEPWLWFPEMWQELFPKRGSRDIKAFVLVPGLWPLLVGLLIGCTWRVRKASDVEPPPWVEWRARRISEAIARTPLRNGYLTVGLSVEDEKSRVVLPEGTTNTGLLVLGATGAGKTRGVISMLDDVVASGHPVAYVDLKGSTDVPLELAGLAAKYKRPFWHFKLFDASKDPYEGPSATGPASYNPASKGDPTRRKDLIMAALKNSNEYYSNLAGAYALTAFTVLQQAGRLEGRSALAAILSVMKPDDLLRVARSIPTDNPMRARLIEDASGEVSKAKADRNYAQGLYGLEHYLSQIMDSVAGPFINDAGEDVIDFAEVDRTGGIVVFSLSDMEYASLPAQLGSLIVQDFATYAGIREKDSAVSGKPFYLVVDEFSAFGRDNILGLLARGRSAGVHTILATQNLADLYRAGEGFREQVLGIVGSFMFFRGNVQSDCELMSGLTGREGAEGFVPWEELQGLGTGECVVVNNMPIPSSVPKGLRVGRRERARVILRDIPTVKKSIVQLQVTNDSAGNWLAQAPVDASAEAMFEQMRTPPAWISDEPDSDEPLGLEVSEAIVSDFGTSAPEAPAPVEETQEPPKKRKKEPVTAKSVFGSNESSPRPSAPPVIADDSEDGSPFKGLDFGAMTAAAESAQNETPEPSVTSGETANQANSTPSTPDTAPETPKPLEHLSEAPRKAPGRPRKAQEPSGTSEPSMAPESAPTASLEPLVVYSDTPETPRTAGEPLDVPPVDHGSLSGTTEKLTQAPAPRRRKN